jgi:hypothetical protein
MQSNTRPPAARRRTTPSFDTRLSLELDVIVIALDECPSWRADYTWLRLAKVQLEERAFGGQR